MLIRFRRDLKDTAGREAHAASHIRKRLVELDEALLGDARELHRILTHELFHFVWARLDNASRRTWSNLLLREIELGTDGELGWSAELRKEALGEQTSGRRWRDYICESFCDTAAWYFTRGRHAEFTLGRDARRVRERWIRALLAKPRPL